MILHEPDFARLCNAGHLENSILKKLCASHHVEQHTTQSLNCVVGTDI